MLNTNLITRPLAIVVAVAALGAAGVITFAESQAASPSARAASAGTGSAVKALRTAAKAAAGRPYDLERDRHRGRRVWEVDVAKRAGRASELVISADGTRVVKRHRTHRSDDAAKARRASIGLAKALRTASRRASGTLTEADIDRTRGGRLVWSVTFERGQIETEVDVDARSGKVVRVQTEHDD
jgi:uncharacterized membrane protein YkoI